MAQMIDPSLYIQMPRLDVPSGISLGKMLLAAMPKTAPASVKKSSKKLHAAVTELESAWKSTSEPIEPSVDIRALDKRLDNLWAAVSGRLEPFSTLVSGSSKRKRAEEIIAILFPTGLGFLKLAYLAEHAESQKRLDLIVERKLEKDIDMLVGDDFVTELRSAHSDYGRALGVTAKAAAAPSTAKVAVPLRKLTGAMSSYAVQLLAMADDDDGNVPVVQGALSPIDKFRAAAQQRSGTGLPPDAPPPTAPVPSTPAVEEVTKK